MKKMRLGRCTLGWVSDIFTFMLPVSLTNACIPPCSPAASLCAMEEVEGGPGVSVQLREDGIRMHAIKGITLSGGRDGMSHHILGRCCFYSADRATVTRLFSLLRTGQRPLSFDMALYHFQKAEICGEYMFCVTNLH